VNTITVREARTGNYTIDPTRSHLGFTVRLLPTKVRGSFAQVEDTGRFDAENPARSTITLRWNAAGIDTSNPRRDAHLRSRAFLGVDAHPVMTFSSTAVEPISAERFRVDGALTIKDTTRPVTVEVTRARASVDESGMPRLDFEGHAVIRRTDWGVRWNAILEAGGLVIGHKVAVEFAVSAVGTDVDRPGALRQSSTV
jgi:polyisoprenoid-binding protein YceI